MSARTLDPYRFVCEQKDGNPLSLLPERLKFKSAYLEITNECNLRCIHCSNFSGPRLENELDTNEIKNIIERLYRICPKLIFIRGGEPLLRNDCIEIIEHAISQNLKVTLITNGTKIDDIVAQSLSNLGVNVQISLDGASAKTHDKIRGKGAFGATIEGINHLISHGMTDKLITSVTLMKQNIEDIPEIIHLVLNLEITKVFFTFVQKQGRAILNWPEFEIPLYEKIWSTDTINSLANDLNGILELEISGYTCEEPYLSLFTWEKPQIGCSASTEISIDPIGYVHACPFFDNLQRCVGATKKITLDEILKAHPITSSRIPNITKCENCLNNYKCGGGCPCKILAIQKSQLRKYKTK